MTVTTDTPVRGVERAALSLVIAEVARAREKFGEQNDYSDDAWLAVLVEEVGESAELLNEVRLGRLEERIAADALANELVQVAAVAVRWLAAMGRR